MRWLTERDKKIIKFIYFHRFVSTNQVVEIFFKKKEDGSIIKYPQNVARKRLQKYREEGLIKSFYTSNSDLIHTIDEKGVYVVAGILNTTFNKLYFNPKEDLLSIGLANHSLKLNDLYIILRDAALKKGGNIIDFRVEVLNRVSFIYQNKKQVFQPDIYFVYQPDKNKSTGYPFFIELDLETESPKKYKEKILNYENYHDSKDFQNQYGIFPRIVTVTNTKSRSDRLKGFCKTKLDWRYLTMEEIERILII